MSRLVLLAATILTLGVSLAATAPRATIAGEQRVSELELVVETGDGSLRSAHFLVAAEDEAEARRAAAAATRALYPGATLHDAGHAHGADAALEAGPSTGMVRAEWNAWGWSWDASELPVPVRYNPAAAPAGFETAAMPSALAAWSGVPGSGFAFTYAGETALPASMNTSGEDGANVVAWQDLGCDGGCVLGLTTKSFTSHEVDISLNSNPQARLGTGEGDTYDILTVLVHELGHVAGLEHSCPALGPCTEAELGAVMFWSYRGVQRQLQPDDIAALVALYPGEAVTPDAAGPTAGPGAAPVAAVAPSMLVSLVPGWNLTQLPAGPIDGIASSLTCARAIYAFDGDVTFGWSHWVRDLRAPLQTLHSTAEGVAYWVLSDSACDVEFR